MTERDFENQLFLNLVANVKSNTLTFFELGAGIGDWCLEIAGILDYQIIKTQAKTYRCLGVEGELVHFQWGKEHFEKQSIRGEMLLAAVSNYDGECKFTSWGDPATWYGQSISELGNIIVLCFTVDTLMRKYGFDHLDICHMNIQGAEVKAIEGCKEAIKEKKIDYFSVRTHSLALHQEVENLLRSDYNLVISIRPGTGLVETLIGKANIYQDGIIIAERKELEES